MSKEVAFDFLECKLENSFWGRRTYATWLSYQDPKVYPHSHHHFYFCLCQCLIFSNINMFAPYSSLYQDVIVGLIFFILFYYSYTLKVLFYLYIYMVFCLHVHLCTMCLPGVHRNQKRHQIHWNLSHRWL